MCGRGGSAGLSGFSTRGSLVALGGGWWSGRGGLGWAGRDGVQGFPGMPYIEAKDKKELEEVMFMWLLVALKMLHKI